MVIADAVLVLVLSSTCSSRRPFSSRSIVTVEVIICRPAFRLVFDVRRNADDARVRAHRERGRRGDGPREGARERADRERLEGRLRRRAKSRRTRLASEIIAAQAGEDGVDRRRFRQYGPVRTRARHGPDILGDNDELAPSSVQSPSG